MDKANLYPGYEIVIPYPRQPTPSPRTVLALALGVRLVFFPLTLVFSHSGFPPSLKRTSRSVAEKLILAPRADGAAIGRDGRGARWLLRLQRRPLRGRRHALAHDGQDRRLLAPQ